MIRALVVIVALVIAALVAFAIFFMMRGGTETYPNRDPTGETFPLVSGQSLEGEAIELPDSLAGEPVILLVGYLQRAQFDIDRWVMGLLQAEAGAPIIELPTIPGLIPSLGSRWIDEGMRSGIPSEDWGAVVTLYGDAARPVAELTGTERGRLTRVIVLDSDGRVVWFDDEGYSPRKALAVAERVRQLRASG